MSAFIANPHFQPVSSVATMNSVTPCRPQYTCTWPSYEYNAAALKKTKNMHFPDRGLYDQIRLNKFALAKICILI